MALKVMRHDKLTSERARQRFDREARLGAQLRHGNLRAVHELGSYEGRPHMALSWVDTSLEELLEHAPGKRLEPEVVCWFGIQACSALAAAHAHVDHRGEPAAIVHGDVSPGNILLTLSGHVLLADLAATLDPSPARTSEQGAGKGFFGSLGYAPPEALKGSLVDGRADLFSLACVLYEALCGAPAFEADDERTLMFQVLERGPIDLALRAPQVPPNLVSVVRRALQRSAAERFASAEEMRQALWACLPESTAFVLERRSADVIGRVLGERIRQREEAMRLILSSAASQLERTDTLPIGNALRRRDSTTLPSALTDAPPSTRRGTSVSDPGVVVALVEPDQGRRTLWVALAAVALATSAYLAWPAQRARAPASAAVSAGASLLPASAPETKGPLSPTPAPVQAPEESGAGSTAVVTVAQAGAPQPPASSSGSARDNGATRTQRPPPRGAAPVPFQFRPTKNPYAEKRTPRLKSAPTR
jgi:serine/threonine-protein kinase